MGRGLASIYGALILLFLFSTMVASMYLTTQIYSSIIREEATNAASDLKKEAELVKAVYTSALGGFNISVRNLGSEDTNIEYIVAMSNDTPVYVKKINYIIRSGVDHSFIINIPVKFDNIYLVTKRGNFIPVLTVHEPGENTNEIIITNNSIWVNNPDLVYQYFPPYTLLIRASSRWYQIYMENLSIIHAGTKILYSLDRNISYIFGNELLFINNKFIGKYLGTPIGIGRNYIVLNSSDVIRIYFSDAMAKVFGREEYLGYYGGVFWFLTSSIKLDNGTFLTELSIVDDYGFRHIYVKYFFGINKLSIKYPRIVGNTLYIIFNDSELIYTASFSISSIYNGSPVYSPIYTGSIGRWFKSSLIKSKWGVTGDLRLGYDDNLAVFDIYVRDTYFRGVPSSFVGPVAIYVWQNESSVPVDLGWSGKLIFQGGVDEFGVGDIIWIKYIVFNRKAIQYPYDEYFIISIVLSSSLAKYYINITIDGVHGSGRYNIFPVGWIINYNIKEVFSFPFEREAFSYTYSLEYTNNYSQYPFYTWYSELIGFRRVSADSVELLFLNKWGDYVVRRNNTLSIDMPILDQNYQFEIRLYSHINYSEYIPILNWPREQAVAGLYIHNILFSGNGNNVDYIGPLKPSYSQYEYNHYTDYQHSFDIVLPNGDSFGRHYWLGLNSALIMVSPRDYPEILQYNYLELVGLKWYNTPPDAGFIDGYPGVYSVVGGVFTAVDWVTSVVDDLAYEILLYGDYILLVHYEGSVDIHVYSCWEVAG